MHICSLTKPSSLTQPPAAQALHLPQRSLPSQGAAAATHASVGSSQRTSHQEVCRAALLLQLLQQRLCPVPPEGALDGQRCSCLASLHSRLRLE